MPTEVSWEFAREQIQVPKKVLSALFIYVTCYLHRHFRHYLWFSEDL